MIEAAAHLVDHVLPEQPIRQWVLTFPYPLRFLFAAQPQVLSQVLGVVYRAISTYLIRVPDRAVLDLKPGEALDQLVGVSIQYRIAIGPNAGKKALTLRTVPAHPEPFASTLLAEQPGLSPSRYSQITRLRAVTLPMS